MSGAAGAFVLVVEDDPQVGGLIRSLVEGRGDHCLIAGDIAAARRILAAQEVQLVLCDIELRGESGLDLVRWLQLERPSVAVVMVTAIDDTGLAESALAHGAYGYVVKPFRANDLLIAIQNALRRRSVELESDERRGLLEHEVVERTDALASAVGRLADAEDGLHASEEETVSRLALAAELRDAATGRHIARVSRSSALLAERLGLGRERSEILRLASQLHDIGKIGIPDEILHKTGPLSEAERAVMKRHPEIGHRILSKSPSPLLQTAAVVALSHHERWDGTGYPLGLTGERIPIEGRIVAVADVFDALTTARSYRPAFSLDEAVAMLAAGRETHFDPDILARFLESQRGSAGTSFVI
ncbi:MAG: HD domain-containing phosphohydrolase [Gaiellaceae bacterium]